MNIKRSGRTLVTTSSSVELTRKIEFAVGFRSASRLRIHPRSSLSLPRLFAARRPRRACCRDLISPAVTPVGTCSCGGFYGDGLFPGHSCRVRGYFRGFDAAAVRRTRRHKTFITPREDRLPALLPFLARRRAYRGLIKR